MNNKHTNYMKVNLENSLLILFLVKNAWKTQNNTRKSWNIPATTGKIKDIEHITIYELRKNSQRNYYCVL